MFESEGVTRLLQRHRDGEAGAEDELFQRVYRDLHRLARHYLRRERPDHTLQPTALVNEAYLRLVNQRSKDWENRSHFIAVAAHVMRHVLVDCARKAKAQKRAFGIAPDSIHEQMIAAHGEDPNVVLAIDSALRKLAEFDSRQAKIVELRYFAGLSNDEIAALLDVSISTVKREWTVARAWLRAELGSHVEAESAPTVVE